MTCLPLGYQPWSVFHVMFCGVYFFQPKCHQYWPDLYETADFGTLQITCVKEEETPSFAFRDFNLTHVEVSGSVQ